MTRESHPETPAKRSSGAPASNVAATRGAAGGSLLPWGIVLAGLVFFYAAYFFPVWSTGARIAPGDGERSFYPFFIQPVQLWTSLILAGYSTIGDPQMQSIYPLRVLSPTFNVFLISAYVIAAGSMYGLSLSLTQSRLASVAAALVMSGSGFMLGHVSHMSVVHAAAWIPATLWASAELTGKRPRVAIAAGALTTALCLFGGHPQISLIGLALCVAFVMHLAWCAWHDRGARAAFVLGRRAFAMFGLGVLLAAPMLVAAAQAGADSVRIAWTRDDFDSFRHTFATLRMLVFPNLYGAAADGPYGPYDGPFNAAELALYVGLLPLFLAGVALVAVRDRRKASVHFWAAAAIASLLLTLGTATPLGEILFHLPVFGRFRGQARFGVVIAISVALLAAYALSALGKGTLPRPRARASLVAACVFCVACVLLAGVAVPLHANGTDRSWAEAGLWVSLALMIASLAVFAGLLRSRTRGFAIVAIVLIVGDLAHFGWFFSWRTPFATGLDQHVVTEVERQGVAMAREDGRVLVLDVASANFFPLRPNINVAHGVASASGYTPLLPQRYAYFTGGGSGGQFPAVPLSAPILDVMGVRWIARDPSGTDAFVLGKDCASPGVVRRARAALPPGAVGHLRVVSHIGCAVDVETGATVAQLRIVGRDGATRAVHPLRAGLETAESSYDRPGHKARMRHVRPPVTEVVRTGDDALLWAVTQVPVSVPAGDSSIVDIELSKDTVPMRIRDIHFVDASGHATRLPLASVLPYEQEALAPLLPGPAVPIIAERRGYRGMAWGLCEASSTPAETIVAALSGAEPANRNALAWSPFREALVEPEWGLPDLTCETAPDVLGTHRSAGRWRLRVASRGAGMLVVSERFDPGWRATVDGARVTVLPVDGLVMGVPLPDGTHDVDLWYRPRFFSAAVALCVLALVACVFLMLAGRRIATHGAARGGGSAGRGALVGAAVVAAVAVPVALLAIAPSSVVAPMTPTNMPPLPPLVHRIPIDDPIRFDRPDISGPVRRVEGLSGYEPWGRWSVGPLVRIELDQPLPPRFTLEMDVASALAPAVAGGVSVRVGHEARALDLRGGSGVHAMEFAPARGARTIEIRVARPASPRELGMGEDPRPLGVGLRSIVVRPGTR